MTNQKAIVSVVVGVLVVVGLLAVVLFFLQRFENEAIQKTSLQVAPVTPDVQPKPEADEPPAEIDDQFPTENGTFLQ